MRDWRKFTWSIFSSSHYLFHVIMNSEKQGYELSTHFINPAAEGDKKEVEGATTGIYEASRFFFLLRTLTFVHRRQWIQLAQWRNKISETEKTNSQHRNNESKVKKSSRSNLLAWIIVTPFWRSTCTEEKPRDRASSSSSSCRCDLPLCA